MRKTSKGIIYSPSDLLQFLDSPFASWMDRYNLEKPGELTPDQKSASDKIIADAGDAYESKVLESFRASASGIVEIPKKDPTAAIAATREALAAKAPMVYQAALEDLPFAGYADFLMLGSDGRYQVWDTKLAQSPKPRYPIQLCAYAEMLAAMTGAPLTDRFGIILGTGERVEFRTEDFIHYYRALKERFLAMQAAFTGAMADRPEPAPRAANGKWESHANAWFVKRDHLVQVAGITTGQIKKLNAAGVWKVKELGAATNLQVKKIAADTQARLIGQARLQVATRNARETDPDAKPHYELLPTEGPNGEPVGLGTLPPAHPGDVFFDMEGYPLIIGGLEYLFGASTHASSRSGLDFHDWWAHDREEERVALEGFIDWVHARWKANPGMHVYHYASYEQSAVERLKKRYNTRQDEVDDLLRNNVFVDLYQVVRHGVRIGEDSYSLKVVERLYRPPRTTDIATAAESIVQYNHWMVSGEPRDWRTSPILKGIRDYNEDDCRSTAELADWLWSVVGDAPRSDGSLPPEVEERKAPTEEQIAARQAVTDLEANLKAKPDATSQLLSTLVDFHHREEKPTWWLMFKRGSTPAAELWDDAGCIAGVRAVGDPVPDKQSYMQRYDFDANQECKLAAGPKVKVKFSYRLAGTFNLTELDAERGTATLRIGRKALNEHFKGEFPATGSLIPKEYVNPAPIPEALAAVATSHLNDALPKATAAFLVREPLAAPPSSAGESTATAVQIASGMDGGWFAVQGPPGTGKTYTAAHVIAAMLAANKSVGICSNSHKAVLNLFRECGKVLKEMGRDLAGIKVGDDDNDPFFTDYPDVKYVAASKGSRAEYHGGIVAGTAWLFAQDEWAGQLDYLIVDEAGQVSLANAVAISRSARNLILLGDQMQLEQPIQGSHPGDSGLSALQFALKDLNASREDAPIFHAVIPPALGLFLGESRRMHPDVCRFVSESIYESRLHSHADCSRQSIDVAGAPGAFVSKRAGIVFSGVVHEGNVQQSDEEVARVVAIHAELAGRPYTDKDGKVRPLALDDFLFIAPYNAQVRAMKAALPKGARVGSVDRFQGQEAAVCILSLCASFGEYGSRGLSFILDRNRVNVAISRAKCLAVVVADPRIATAIPGSIDEMRLINLFVKLTRT